MKTWIWNCTLNVRFHLFSAFWCTYRISIIDIKRFLGGKTQANKLNVQVIKHSMLSRQESIVQLVHNSTTKHCLLYLMSTCNKMNMYFWLVVLRTYVLMTYFIFFLVKITVMSYLWKKNKFLGWGERDDSLLRNKTWIQLKERERERAILFTDH